MPSAPPDPAARARLFVALELPAEARSSLSAWSHDVLGGDESLRLLDAEALHVTLVFLGWREADEIAPIAAAALDAGGGLPAPSLRPRSLVALPSRGPRVLALDLEDRQRRAGDLRAAVASGLADAGLHELEARPFRAHLTVARVRRGGRAPTGRFPDPPRVEVVAGSIVLYRSDLSAQGARYTALRRASLDVRAARPPDALGGP